MNCEWITNQRGQTCIHGCGYALKRDYDDRPVRVCPGNPAVPNLKLGNAVESLLKSFGITQDRYKEVKAKCGLPPTCNCPNRIKDLNEWGERVKAYLRGGM
jgi:hypothetical protein